MDSRKRIIAAFALFVTVFLIGVAGFKVIGGAEWSLLDAVYMTVITVGTVGYGETHDLGGNPAARVFTAAYIILSLGTIAFAVTSITAFVVEGELKRMLGRRKMEKDIARLEGHDIVCGADETAQTIIQELLTTKRDFVVVDADRARLDRLAAAAPFLFVEGDPADDEVLKKAGIERARGILLSLPTDEANLFVTVTARQLNPSVRIVAKGIDVKSHEKMVRAGADYAVSPTFIGGMRMVSQLVRPAAVTFLDMMLREGQGLPRRRGRGRAGVGPGRQVRGRVGRQGQEGVAPRRRQARGRSGLSLQPAGRRRSPGERRPGLHHHARSPQGARSAGRPRLGPPAAFTPSSDPPFYSMMGRPQPRQE
jgi:voltage-gated potassium channel